MPSLQISGPAGQVCRIEASSDLKQWIQIGSDTVAAADQLEFIDTYAAEHPKRFYRVATP